MSVPKHIVAVAGLIRNARGEVLLVRSPRRGWEFPGGQVEEGEDLIGALRREILEEAGVTARIGALVGVYSNLKMPSKVMFGFLGEWVSGELQTSEESLETAWVGPDRVLERISHPAIYDRVKDMLVFDGRIIYRVYTTEPYQIHEQRFL